MMGETWIPPLTQQVLKSSPLQWRQLERSDVEADLGDTLTLINVIFIWCHITRDISFIINHHGNLEWEVFVLVNDFFLLLQWVIEWVFWSELGVGGNAWVHFFVAAVHVQV